MPHWVPTHVARQPEANGGGIGHACCVLDAWLSVSCPEKSALPWSPALHRVREGRDPASSFVATRLPSLHRLVRYGVAVLIASAFSVGVGAQAPAGPLSAVPAPAPTGAGLATTGPIPLAELSSQAAATTAELLAIDAELDADTLIARTMEVLPATIADVNDQVQATHQAAARNASLTTLHALGARLTDLRGKTDGIANELKARAAMLRDQSAHLAALAKRWRNTLAATRSAKSPRALGERAQQMVAAIEHTRTTTERQQASALALLERFVGQAARIAAAERLNEVARSKALKRLFVKEDPPLWRLSAASGAQGHDDADLTPIRQQLDTLAVYVGRETDWLLLHLALFAAIAVGLRALRRRLKVRIGEGPMGRRSAAIFDFPIAIAMILSLVASGAIYPDAPMLMWAVIGAAALLPAVYILHRIVDPRIHPVLYALVVFYIVDQLRIVVAPLALTARLVFIAEMTAGVLVAAWIAHRANGNGDLHNARVWQRIRMAAQLAIALFLAAALAGTLGYSSLAAMLERAVLGGAYLAIVLYATVLALDSLGSLMLSSRPLIALHSVQDERALLRSRLRRTLIWSAIGVWLWVMLERLTLAGPFFDLGTRVVHAGVKVGSIDVTLGDVLAFAGVIWAAVLTSRFVRFVLDEDVFPRVRLPGGLANAISTTLHHALVVAGFVAGVAALGFDMTKLTILVGAFTVGVGFGLQNIINNFVSGLILLFERPVKVGDVIQVDDATGTVERIGIRATVIRTVSGAEIIVPNGNLISARVTNWTRTNRQRMMEIPVSVDASAATKQVIELLTSVARATQDVLSTPPPEALLTRFTPDAMHFELRAWTDRAEDWARVRSDLSLAITRALANENIAVR